MTVGIRSLLRNLCLLLPGVQECPALEQAGGVVPSWSEIRQTLLLRRDVARRMSLEFRCMDRLEGGDHIETSIWDCALHYLSGQSTLLRRRNLTDRGRLPVGSESFVFEDCFLYTNGQRYQRTGPFEPDSDRYWIEVIDTDDWDKGSEYQFGMIDDATLAFMDGVGSVSIAPTESGWTLHCGTETHELALEVNRALDFLIDHRSERFLDPSGERRTNVDLMHSSPADGVVFPSYVRIVQEGPGTRRCVEYVITHAAFGERARSPPTEITCGPGSEIYDRRAVWGGAVPPKLIASTSGVLEEVVARSLMTAGHGAAPRWRLTWTPTSLCLLIVGLCLLGAQPFRVWMARRGR